MKHIPYIILSIFLYFFSQANYAEKKSPEQMRIIVHQKVNNSADLANIINNTIKDTLNTAQKILKSEKEIKKILPNALKDINTIADIEDTINKHTDITLDKALFIESSFDNIAISLESLADQSNTALSITDCIDSSIDELIDPVQSSLDKTCDTLSIMKNIDEDFLFILDDVYSLIEIQNNILSVTDEVNSQVDISLSKVCAFSSVLDSLSTLANLDLTLSGAESITIKLDGLQSTYDSILEKTCDTLSIVEDISSKIDNIQTIANSAIENSSTTLSIIELSASCADSLQEIADSTLDKVCITLSLIEETNSTMDQSTQTGDSILEKMCDILSIIDNVDSKVDVLKSTTDIIESKVCKLCTCDFIITQDDISTGDNFTISLPGVYCLGENVSFSTGTAIFIEDVNNVLLNLGNHTIDGGSNTQTTAILVNNSQSIVMRDGFIQGVAAGIRVKESLGPVNITNVQIRDGSSFDDESDTPGEVGGIIIDDSCNTIVSNCQCARLAPIGFDVRNTSTHCILRECTAQDISNAGFIVSSDSHFCILEHCTAQNNTNDTIDDAFISDSLGTDINGGPGFGIYGIFCCLLQCKVTQYVYNVSGEGNTPFGMFDIRGESNVLHECSATISIADSADTHGFIISGAYHILRSCLAKGNEGNGFQLGDSNFNLTTCKSSFIQCIATENTNNGFIITGQEDNELNLFKKNSALSNGSDGFIIASDAESNRFLSNIAESNDGFGFNSSDTSNLFFNNCACFNDGGNYSTNINLVQRPTDISGFWINADCSATNVGVFESKLCQIEATLIEAVNPMA